MHAGFVGRRGAPGFTLIETLVAVAIGTVVMGGGMYLYLQGAHNFKTLTQHSQFREDSLLVLETIGRDLDQLVVSDEKNPITGNYFMVEPYQLLRPYPQLVMDFVTKKQIPYSMAGTGIRFYKYHHLQMDTSGGYAKPQIIGEAVEYNTVPIDAGDLTKGVNLMRTTGSGTQMINKQPMSEVIFQQEPAQVAYKQIGASPHAVLTVHAVPVGGIWGQMTRDTIQMLTEKGQIVSRTFHLVGYESLYTSMLYRAMEVAQTDPQLASLQAKYPAYVEVYNDAQANNTLGAVPDKIGKKASSAYELPPDSIKILADVPYDDKSAALDASWSSAKVVEGDTSTGGGGALASGGGPDCPGRCPGR